MAGMVPSSDSGESLFSRREFAQPPPSEVFLPLDETYFQVRSPHSNVTLSLKEKYSPRVRSQDESGVPIVSQVVLLLDFFFGAPLPPGARAGVIVGLSIPQPGS